LDRLDKQDQSIVKVAVFDLQQNPITPGFNLEKLKGRNLWSGRVNQDLRLIMHRDGDLLIVLYVGHHDAAYGWADNHEFRSNQKINSMQLVSLEHITERVVHQEVVHRGPMCFQQHTDDYLLALGLPQEWLLPVKQATKEDLGSLIGTIPDEVVERLIDLAEGNLVPVPRPHDGDPLDHPDSLRHFITVEAKNDLARALEYPWAKWTVFLHPEQRDLVESSFAGPAKVSGSAGTGKTVVALHRAFRLATQNPSSNVLLTTYSRTLAARIEQMATVLAGGLDEIPKNLTITNIHRLAVQIWSAHNPGRSFKAADNTEVSAELEAAIGLRILGPLDLGFIVAEWNHIIDYWGITDWESYRDFSRTGRGTLLGRRQREELWSVFGPVLGKISESSSAMTWSQVTFAATPFATKDQSERFQHIVVDESQDFGPAELSLIRALAEPGPDDLFLCGDAGQRIYRRPFSWNGLGIPIQGRSKHLSSNYRNTEQIQRFARSILGRPAIGGDEEEESRDGVSLLTGALPMVKLCKDESDEVLHLAAWLQDMMRLGYAQSEIAVFTRRTRTLATICDPALRMVEGLNRRDLQDSRPSSEDGVSFGTMHRAKGLEFKAVAVVGCSDNQVPDQDMLASACDEADTHEILEQEINLLHVALTRPRERLLVTCTGKPSRFFPEGFDDQERHVV
jgi:mRNA-degrading endonuclease RelE of RelBE toxin-antitoxin system